MTSRRIIFTEPVNLHPLTFPAEVTFWKNDIIERNLKPLNHEIHIFHSWKSSLKKKKKKSHKPREHDFTNIYMWQMISFQNKWWISTHQLKRQTEKRAPLLNKPKKPPLYVSNKYIKTGSTSTAIREFPLWLNGLRTRHSLHGDAGSIPGLS